MTKNTPFLSQLAMITLPLTAITFFLQYTQPEFAPYVPVTWASIIFFTLFSWIVFIFGEESAKAENKNVFIRFYLMTIMGKLFLSVFLIVAFVLIAKPESRLVVLPFIPIYIIYTIFETRFLMRQAKQ